LQWNIGSVQRYFDFEGHAGLDHLAIAFR